MNRSFVLRSLFSFGALVAPSPAFAALAKGAVKTKKIAHRAKATKLVKLRDGLAYEDLVVGRGAMPKVGQTVSVAYTGTLTNGTKFDSSRDRGVPFQFQIGEHQVIEGWDEGVATMRVGGRRKLIIPAALGYGDRGAGGVIPPGATLIFDIELLGIS